MTTLCGKAIILEHKKHPPRHPTLCVWNQMINMCATPVARSDCWTRMARALATTTPGEDFSRCPVLHIRHFSRSHFPRSPDVFRAESHPPRRHIARAGRARVPAALCSRHHAAIHARRDVCRRRRRGRATARGARHARQRCPARRGRDQRARGPHRDRPLSERHSGDTGARPAHRAVRQGGGGSFRAATWARHSALSSLIVLFFFRFLSI